MANYANLKATINANIKANGTEAITGPVLNSVLTAAVNTLGAGYQFMGVATTSTNPGTPDANVFYIAATPGTYTNFGGKTVADGEVAILKYNGSWTKEVTGAATAAQLTQLGQQILNVPIPLKYDYGYIKLTGGVGTIAPVDEPTTSASYDCWMGKCVEGDIIIVNGTGGSTPRLWGFLKSNYEIISYSGAGVSGTGLKLIAPQDAAYVVITSSDGRTSYVAKKYSLPILDERVDSLEGFVPDLINKFDVEWINGYHYTGVIGENYELVAATSNAWNCISIPCQEGDLFLLNVEAGSSFRSYYFCDNNGIVTRIGGITALNTAVYPNEGETLLLVNTQIDSYCYSGIKAIHFNAINNTREIERIKSKEAQWDSVHKDNILWGKKYVACGDSFTASGTEYFDDGPFAGELKNYPRFIALRNNMSLINEAISGSTMAKAEGVEDQYVFSVNRYKAIPADTDYITLNFGINDSAPIGNIDDDTNETFYGAWNIVLEWLITNRPLAKIGIILAERGTHNKWEAMREVAKKWGIPYLDVPKDPSIPMLGVGNGKVNEGGASQAAHDIRNLTFRASESSTLHPNSAGHLYESTFFEAFMRRL